LDSRIPRPLDDGTAATNAAAAKSDASPAGNISPPKPDAGNAAPPPAKNDSAGRVTELGDLPTAL
jgi:hypothetical protein